jgi:hypothetical protein
MGKAFFVKSLFGLLLLGHTAVAMSSKTAQEQRLEFERAVQEWLDIRTIITQECERANQERHRSVIEDARREIRETIIKECEKYQKYLMKSQGCCIARCCDYLCNKNGKAIYISHRQDDLVHIREMMDRNQNWPVDLREFLETGMIQPESGDGSIFKQLCLQLLNNLSEIDPSLAPTKTPPILMDPSLNNFQSL